MKDLGPGRKILGMHIIRDRSKKQLWLSQERYVTKVFQRFNMYAMVCTRPDIGYAVGVVSRFMSNPGKEHWNAVKWILGT